MEETSVSRYQNIIYEIYNLASCHSASITTKGTLVGRQRVPVFNSPLAPHVTLAHIKIGDKLTLLGRNYLVTSCEPATRRYLIAQGFQPSIDLNDQPPPPPPPTSGKLRFSSEWPRQYPLEKFTKNSGQVLRFYGEWVGQGPRQGGAAVTPVTEKVEVRYYLEDDTMEVRQHGLTEAEKALNPANPPRPAKILRRSACPKDLSEMNGASSVGAVGRPTLNLVGLRGVKAHLQDRRPQAPNSPGFLRPEDLILGDTISIAGRLVRLCECDEFTMQWYSLYLGHEQKPAGYEYLTSSMGSVPGRRRAQPLDPRWLEESPKDPLHPFPTTVTIANHNAHTTNDNEADVILRFGAILLTNNNKDSEREFVINFYAYDSTISVFEVPKLNSGIWAGTFLSRGLVVGSNGHVSSQDLYVGGRVMLNGHHFHIIYADEFTLNYMEKNAHEFSHANFNVAMDYARQQLMHHDLSALAQDLSRHDPNNTGYAPTTTVVAALATKLKESELSLQQVMTLCRRHRQQRPAPLNTNQLTHLAALHLKRVNFDGISECLKAMKCRDPEASGRLPIQSIRDAIMASRLPLSAQLLDAVLNSVLSSGDGRVDYQDLCRSLDWRQRPHIHDNPPCQLQDASLKTAQGRMNDLVNYIALVKDLEGSAAAHHTRS